MSKPSWARFARAANALERQAKEFRAEALEQRCPQREDGGHRCTMDRGHEDNHRIRQEDLP